MYFEILIYGSQSYTCKIEPRVRSPNLIQRQRQNTESDGQMYTCSFSARLFLYRESANEGEEERNCQKASLRDSPQSTTTLFRSQFSAPYHQMLLPLLKGFPSRIKKWPMIALKKYDSGNFSLYRKKCDNVRLQKVGKLRLKQGLAGTRSSQNPRKALKVIYEVLNWSRFLKNADRMHCLEHSAPLPSHFLM